MEQAKSSSHNFAHLWLYVNDLLNIDFTKVCPAVYAKILSRFDWGGGWGDTPPIYYKLYASIVASSLSFNATNQHALTVTISPAREFRFSVDDAIEDPPELIVKIFEFLGFYSQKNFPPICLNIYNIIPRGSGLGGSGLVVATTLAALFGYYLGIDYPNKNIKRLVEYTMAIEQLQGTGGGWNDTLTGIIPGTKLIRTQPDNPHRYIIERLPQRIADELAKHCILIDLNHTRQAAPIVHSIRDRYLGGDEKVISMLQRIEQDAQRMWNLLIDKKFIGFGEEMYRSWQNVCSVETKSRIKIVDEIEDLLKEYIAGLKIGGAGGGGFMMIVCTSPEQRDFAIMILRKHFSNPEANRTIKVYSPQFPPIGLRIGYLQPETRITFDEQPTTMIIE